MRKGQPSFSEFRRTALEAFEAIPERFRDGVDALVASEDAVPHPSLPDIYTLGHCDTEFYLSEWDGPETVRSVVVLYYGSFVELARLDSDFDWRAEIYETVEHEVRHHLESLAGEDQLGGVDYALDQSYRRSEGLDWDPWYFQWGDPIGGGMYAVEDQVYMEQEWTAEDFSAAGELSFGWQGVRYRIPRPTELGDVHFVWLRSGVRSSPPALELVLVRRRGWWDDARRLVGSSRPRVLESEADAELVEED